MFLLHSLFHSFILSCLFITFSINLIGNMLKVEEIKRDLDLNREIRLYLNQSRVSELVKFEIEIEVQRGNLNILSSIWVPLNFKGNLSEELFLKCFPWNLKNKAFDSRLAHLYKPNIHGMEWIAIQSRGIICRVCLRECSSVGVCFHSELWLILEISLFQNQNTHGGLRISIDSWLQAQLMKSIDLLGSCVRRLDLPFTLAPVKDGDSRCIGHLECIQDFSKKAINQIS